MMRHWHHALSSPYRGGSGLYRPVGRSSRSTCGSLFSPACEYTFLHPGFISSFKIIKKARNLPFWTKTNNAAPKLFSAAAIVRCDSVLGEDARGDRSAHPHAVRTNIAPPRSSFQIIQEAQVAGGGVVIRVDGKTPVIRIPDHFVRHILLFTENIQQAGRSGV